LFELDLRSHRKEFFMGGSVGWIVCIMMEAFDDSPGLVGSTTHQEVARRFGDEDAACEG